MHFPEKVLNLDEMIKFFEDFGEARRMTKINTPKQTENYFAVSGWLQELKDRKAAEWILYEDKTIFDGWCAKFKLTGEIEIREQFKNMISSEAKDKITADITRDLKKIKKKLAKTK